MIMTDDPAVANRCRSLRNLCFKTNQRFVHDELGWNFRITNLQAALGLAQLERLDEFVQIKRRMGSRYTQLLDDTQGIQLPIEHTDYAHNIYWVFGMVLDDNVAFDAKEAMALLGKLGIGSRPFFEDETPSSDLSDPLSGSPGKLRLVWRFATLLWR